MAVNDSTRFSNAAVGIPQVGADFDKFETSSEPKYAVGYAVQDAEGNIYRYSHFGAYTHAGNAVGQDLSESSSEVVCGRVLAPASCQTTTDNTKGYRYVEITHPNIAAHQYSGGHFAIFDGLGLGKTYFVEDNTVTGDPASTTCRFTLREPLQDTLSATTDFVIMGSKYANLESAISTADFNVAGVTTTIQEADYYGWVVTKGCVNVLLEGTMTAGEAVVVSSTTAGCVTTATARSVTHWFKPLGQVVVLPATGYAMCDLNME